MTSVISQIIVNAPPSLAYRAFTNATSLREWLCDVATVSPHPRGRMYLWWNGDFYSSGHYEDVEPDKRILFRWYSNIDPLPTQVEVTFTEQEGGTLVRMEHFVPNDGNWNKIAENFRRNWDGSLDNLKSVLETGIDRRIADRPMLGIMPGDFTPEQAAHLGIPVTEGIRLDGVVEGMGAHQAGLQKNDVLVGFNGKPLTNEPNSLPAALSGKKGGDDVEVVFYRGPKKHTATMKLTKRPMAAVPFDSGLLVMQAAPKYDAAFAAIQKAFAGASDEQAKTRPAPGEWSALDTVAHILEGERRIHQLITDLAGGYESIADDWGGNLDPAIQAFTATYPTIDSMLGELRRAFDHTLTLVSLLPPGFAANRGSFYRVGNWLLLNDQHIYTHISQIESALAAAR